MKTNSELPERLVLFDGLCGLCDRSVQFMLDHDDEKKLFFAPLEGETASRVKAAHPELEGVDSVVFVDRTGGTEKVSVRSKAVFAIAKHLDRRARWLGIFGVLPQKLADIGYDSVAAIRYSVFGKLETCRIPDASVRARFLD